MNYQELVNLIKKKKSLLCIGLDTDLSKIPKFLLKYDDPIFEFNKFIIDATKDLAVAYKPNFAFYEALGTYGWNALKKTSQYLPKDTFKIADAKRGDIGNTASYYAKAIFDDLGFDAITISPYMGKDSVTPFLAYKDKWTIVLALTSNSGSEDFQKLKVGDDFLFEQVLKKSSSWGSHENMMYVFGATQSEAMKKVRDIIPNHFLLIPGVGEQGGSLDEVIKNGKNKDFGMFINSSRKIIYASNDENFFHASRAEALKNVEEMRSKINF